MQDGSGWKANTGRLRSRHAVSGTFGHLVGGYGAGYYGYMWSEVLALDMLSVYGKNLMNPVAGRRFRELILSKGGKGPPPKLCASFSPRSLAKAFSKNHRTARRLSTRHVRLRRPPPLANHSDPARGRAAAFFFLFTWVGGDPAYLLAGKISNPEQIESIRRQLGVDRPFHVQLWIFIQQIATGDFGESWSTNEKVSAIFATRLGPSLTVLVPLLAVDTLLAIAAAMLVAYVRGSLTDPHGHDRTGTSASRSASSSTSSCSSTCSRTNSAGFRSRAGGNGLTENLLRFSLLPIIVG